MCHHAETTNSTMINGMPMTAPTTVMLNSFIGQYGTEWAPLMAASTVVAVPIVVLFDLFQRFIAGGLTAGSVKD
jgi:multiple sugar transport system permease protein